MSRSFGTCAWIALSVLSLTACNPPAATQSATPAAPPAAAPMVFETMATAFAPHSNKLWELAGNLYADNGELDAKQLNDQQWQELSAAAAGLRDGATALANATALRVAPAGTKLQNEGAPGALGMAQLQALLDGNPAGFKAEALQLATVAGNAVSAAATRDAAQLDEASNQLNEVCTSCHNKFWYPNQPEQ